MALHMSMSIRFDAWLVEVESYIKVSHAADSMMSSDDLTIYAHSRQCPLIRDDLKRCVVSFMTFRTTQTTKWNKNASKLTHKFPCAFVRHATFDGRMNFETIAQRWTPTFFNGFAFIERRQTIHFQLNHFLNFSFFTGIRSPKLVGKFPKFFYSRTIDRRKRLWLVDCIPTTATIISCDENAFLRHRDTSDNFPFHRCTFASVATRCTLHWINRWRRQRFCGRDATQLSSSVPFAVRCVESHRDAVESMRSAVWIAWQTTTISCGIHAVDDDRQTEAAREGEREAMRWFVNERRGKCNCVYASSSIFCARCGLSVDA